MNTIEDFYSRRLGTHEKNTFSEWSPMRYFVPPRNPHIFILLVGLAMAGIQSSASMWMIPSVVAVLLMWNVAVLITKRHEILMECVVHELVCADDLSSSETGDEPDSVTDEDRESILDDRVHQYSGMSLWQEVKMFWPDLVEMTLLYAAIYGAMWMLFCRH